MWTYLTLPFSLLLDTVSCEEAEPYDGDGETWRTLRITFAKAVATHSAEQTLYVDSSGLIRRHDYDVEISGGARAAHYLYDHQRFGGIVFPTRRRIFPRGPGRTANKDVVIFSADLHDFTLSG